MYTDRFKPRRSIERRYAAAIIRIMKGLRERLHGVSSPFQMLGKAYKKRRGSLKKVKEWKRPHIGYKEMAMIRHELNTNLIKEERKMSIVVRCIKDGMYAVRNYGFDNYEVLDKIDLN